MLAPFVASAEIGPNKVTAPPRASHAPAPTKGGGLRHMQRGNVSRHDDGCGDD